MDRSDPAGRARHFRALHDRTRALLLPNAWDAGSARLLESLGFPAIATTSGGVAWSLGWPDGEHAPLDELVAATARIVRAVAVPVSADIESGYGATPDAVAANVRHFIDAGVVGINLEDGIAHAQLRDVSDAAARIEAARRAADAAGVDLFINARVDTWIAGFGASEDARIAETLHRASAYLRAGADGIYPIGVTAPATIETLCRAIDAPVNVGARPGLPPLAELARLGVARVTTATRLATLAFGAVHEAAAALQAHGGFDGLEARFGYAEAQRLFHPD